MTSLITHDVPLRPDLVIRLTLPVDLTHDDATRLCGFIASLAFFIWWQFIRKPSAKAPKRPKPREVPQGPKMAVPRGRVR